MRLGGRRGDNARKRSNERERASENKQGKLLENPTVDEKRSHVSDAFV